MQLITVASDDTRREEWRWRIGLILESPELLAEISSVLSAAGATIVFELPASASPFDVASAVERAQPEVLFAELARLPKSAAEWIAEVRRGRDLPLIIAVHPTTDPAEMISALRAGAGEFLALPVRPAIYDAMERLGVLLETRKAETQERGRVLALLSAKGGCGATSLACHLGLALQSIDSKTRVLVADLDYQSPGAQIVFHKDPQSDAGSAFEAVRRLSSSSWREFAVNIKPGLDLLASPAVNAKGDTPELPEQWRTESLFRFVSHHYNWVLVDLGRHLNPTNWTFLQYVDDLVIVTAPDVLALFQTRSVLQTLTSRGFDKSRVKLVLNRNQVSPADFWVESIQQMFEMGVYGVIPNDDNLEKVNADRFDFPSDAPFGRSLTKIASRLLKGNGSGRKAA